MSTYEKDMRELYDRRVRELSRMPKWRLADLFRVRCTQFLWSAVAPERWSKDELINEVLRVEFPGRDR